MLFHEIYGSYYNCVAKILALAIDDNLTDESMKRIINKNAFSESFLTIIPSLKNQNWQLLDENLKTPLHNRPSMPLTILQKRWLKAISLDPRIRLFDVNTETLDDIEPLFTPDDYVVFDKYSDGDPFEDEAYISNFCKILRAVKEKRKLKITYPTRKGNVSKKNCKPLKLEYSGKDDKFRLIIAERGKCEMINLGKIISCEVEGEYSESDIHLVEKKKEYILMSITDRRNALERVLLHFAHFEKQAEKLSENQYRVTIYYDSEDETELVIRVLSFGPMLTVTEPEHFVGLIKERLIMQKKLFSEKKTAHNDIESKLF